MFDPRFDRMAQVMVRYSTRVRPGELVAIRGSAATYPLLRALYREVLQAGAHPHVFVEMEELAPLFFELADEKQLTFVSPVQRLVVETFDVILRVRGESNTKLMSRVDPRKQALFQGAQRELTETYLRRAAEGKLKWCLTLFPTSAYAQDAQMSLEEFTEFVFEACQVNDPDPVARWQAQSARQQQLIDFLKDKKEVRILGPDTDLTLSIEGRTFINADGTHNFPDGEIFTGPVETSVQGHIYFSIPSVHNGREVRDVRLWFEDGRVVKATAGTNQEFLERILNTDEGARYLGEFAFGTNYGIQTYSLNTLFDEKIGGTVHMALGAGYPETGSQNRSAVHWDLICDLRREGEVWVDGELFMKDGRYLLWEA